MIEGGHLLDILEQELDVERRHAGYLLAGARHHDALGGIPIPDVWSQAGWSVRDELCAVVSLYFDVCHFVSNTSPTEPWRLKFDVAYLFFMKANTQTFSAIFVLVDRCCYSDAFSLLRTLLTRLHLQLLFSLRPTLFDDWLENPDSELYLDRHVLDLLENNNIPVLAHIYDLASEVVHGQAHGLSNVGYFEKGIFARVPAIENEVLVLTKFCFGMLAHLGLAVLDLEGSAPWDQLRGRKTLFEELRKSVLESRRFDHLTAHLAEDRHWEDVGKNKWRAGASFDFDAVKEQLEKFHRRTGQQKRLPKKYRL